MSKYQTLLKEGFVPKKGYLYIRTHEADGSEPIKVFKSVNELRNTLIDSFDGQAMWLDSFRVLEVPEEDQFKNLSKTKLKDYADEAVQYLLETHSVR